MPFAVLGFIDFTVIASIVAVLAGEAAAVAAVIIVSKAFSAAGAAELGRSTSRRAVIRRAASWILGIAGLVGLILFLSFEGHSGQGQSVFRMGSPDPWFVWEYRPDSGNRFEMNLLR